MRMRVGWVLAAVVAVVAVTLASVDSGRASFPGLNGKVIYNSSSSCDNRGPATGRCGGTYLAAANPRRAGRARRLTCGGPYCRALDPDVSPNGRKIAYEGRERPREIWVTGITGGRSRVVAHGFSPAWGPRGRRIVFVGDELPEDRALTVKRVGSKRGRRITPGSSPDWSSRGRIAFMRFAGDEDTSDIYLTGVSGRKVTRLTRGGRSRDPSWSPDGRRLVISRLVRNRPQIVIIDRRGRTLRVLTRRGGETPAWSPDGEQIAFYRFNPRFANQGAIYVVNVRGGGLRRIARYASSSGIAWAPRTAARR